MNSRQIIIESIRMVLNEGSTAKKAKKDTIDVIHQCPKWQRIMKFLDEPLPESSEFYPSRTEYIEKSVIRHFFKNKQDRVMSDQNEKMLKWESAVAFISINQFNFEDNGWDNRACKRLKLLIQEMYRQWREEGKEWLGVIPTQPGELTMDILESYFGENVSANQQAVQDELANTKFEHNDSYSVIDVGYDYNMAHRLGEWTGAPEIDATSKLCYTQSKSVWNNQFCAMDNKLYILCREGWKEEQPVKGENCPHDDYGDSMIWVFIAPDGDVEYANTRWNHVYDNGDLDHRYSPIDLSRLLGQRYDNVLKPFTPEEIEYNNANIDW